MILVPTKRTSIWKEAEIEPEGEWYLQQALAWGDVLKITDENKDIQLQIGLLI